MKFFINLFYKLLSLFKKKLPPNDPPPDCEVIFPVRFQYIQDEDEETERTGEKSLELFKAYLKAERSKQEAVAKTTRDVIIQRKIIEEKDFEIITHLSLNPWLDEELQRRIAEEEGEDSIKIKACLARRPVLSLDLQKILAKDKDKEVRRMLARWQRPINPAIAQIMIQDPDVEIRKTIAQTIGEKIKVDNIISFKHGGGQTQKILVQDKDPEVRYCLALNKNLNSEAQILLAQKCIELGEWATTTLLSENSCITLDCEKIILELLEPIKLSYYKSAIIKKLKENKTLQSRKKLC